MRKKLFILLFVILCLVGQGVRASHLVGGEMNYRYMGDTVIGGIICNKYKITLYLFQDCLNGQPEAIQQDNPAFLSIFDQASGTFIIGDTSIYYTDDLEVPANFSNSCVTNAPKLCLRRKTFTRTYALPPSPTGYLIAYQRCCRNSAIMNIVSPGDKGSTYFCTIPPAPNTNRSAVFRNYPPQIICINNPIFYDHSATDDDGDSLSYEFCNAQLGASDADIKPLPKAPTNPAPDYYPSVQYIYPYTAASPLSGSPSIKIDPNTGIISGTPNRLGRFLVTVCCHEWRNGRLINTVKREFQFVVTDCSKAVVADIPILSNLPNTYLVNCQDYTIRFVNNSKGGFSYKWDFGVEGISADVSTEKEPTYVYPDTGTFTVRLVVNPGTTCPDSISRFVKVYPRFRTDFDDSGVQCPGIPIKFQDFSSSTIQPVVSWQWFFGDGATSTDQNPVHTYTTGGTYNVLLSSSNSRQCADTAVKQLVIQNFRPFAGKDTVIVKGERINFNAQGGVTYQWTPGTRLSDTSIPDPVGYYPDTAIIRYYLRVQSAYGCIGYDTIKVTVVNGPSFFVPSAFTPNGDGRNDIFRPISVGYSGLKFFRVFNRFGQEVFYSESIETGWDGTFKGVNAELGVYYWVIRYVDRFGTEGETKGDVTLIR